MKALVKQKSGFDQMQVIEVEEPKCGPDDVKVEIAFTGICGTDLHIFHDTFKSYPPVILGHEASGVIVEVGDHVSPSRLGERVAILGSTEKTCGFCENCKQGYYMFCATRRGMGHGVNGSFTKYVVIGSDLTYRLPDHISLEIGSLAEPLACVVQALEELGPITSGSDVLLTGPGPIGLLSIALLVHKGCSVTVIGTESDSERLTIALELGATNIVNLSADKSNEQLKGVSFDYTVDCSGVPSAIQTCLEFCKPRGSHFQIGIVGKKFELDYDVILYKQLNVHGSLAHSFSSWEKVMKLFEQNKINLQPLITHTYPLEKWREAFELCEEKKGGKVLITYQ